VCSAQQTLDGVDASTYYADRATDRPSRHTRLRETRVSHSMLLSRILVNPTIRMKLSAEELTALTRYQIGALKGFLDAEDVLLHHVKVRHLLA